MPILTVEDVREYLTLKDGVDEDMLQKIVAAAESVVLSYLGVVSLEETDYEELYNGTGSQRLVLDHGPIVSITELNIDGRNVPAINRAQRPWIGYMFDTGTTPLVVTQGHEKFWKGLLNVSIKYRAGYADIPAQITQAALYVAAHIYRRRDRIGVSSKTIGPETISYSSNDMTSSAKELLNDYRRRWFTS